MTESTDTENVKEEEVEAVKALPYVIFFSGGVIAAILLALIVNFFVLPAMGNKDAQSKLDELSRSNGKIVAVNTEIVTFQGQKLATANTEQKALAKRTSLTEPAGFIYSNGAEGERKVVNAFIDFSNQKSRDFLLMNKNNLQSMIAGGVIELRIHPVPTGNAFSIYAAEAIAESFYTSPDQSWEFMFELLRLSATVDTDKADDIVRMIVDTAKAVGVTDVDEESIKNGTFASWIISVGDDPRLKVGFYPPLIYVNGTLIDTKAVNINNPDDLRRVLMKE